MEEFKAGQVVLDGANIIEASAGTGKTFSIAVLVVRLLIEKDIPIEKMLLVTFTEAAAAELKERSVKFIREALQELEQVGSSKNEMIKKIVGDSIAKSGDKKSIEQKLRTAILNIDNAMMCTIHSFCQQTLNEFAFETNQVFGKELKTDISDVVTKHTNGLRREVLSIMDAELLEFSELSNSTILEGGIRNALSGQRLLGSENIHTSIEVLRSNVKLLEEELNAYIEERLEEFIVRVDVANISGFGAATKIKVQNLLYSVDSTINTFLNRTTDKIPLLFENEIQFCKDKKNEITRIENSIKSNLLQQSIDWILPKVFEELKKGNYFTFDDLIDSLYDAREKEGLKSVIRAKYDVVFVDEFQDTDKKQYAVFKTLFQEDSTKTIFYIGDPKQSIYSFRKADLNTYFEARNSIVPMKRFTMKTNFRSTKAYIEALNHFFLPNESFDTFENGNVAATYKIAYEKVEANKESEEGLRIAGELVAPLTIVQGYTNDAGINESTKKTIRHLLNSDVLLDGKPIKPSNITILIRTNSEGKTVKRILENEKIPSVILDDSKIVQSEESNELLYVLQAILNSKKSLIQKALLTELLGKKVVDLEFIDFDQCVEQFTNYLKTWEKDGIFVALNQLVIDFKVVEKHQSDTTKGHRVLSNLRQLLELLQEKEQNNDLTPNEVYIYLYNQTKSLDSSENADLSQRIESDEDAVKIVTIHKSKGLEYDVIIAPYLDLEVKDKFTFSSVRIENNGVQEYIFARNPIQSNEIRAAYFHQQAQEDRRLLYVALTRAKYNAIILNKNKKHHCFSDFVNVLETLDKSQIPTISIKSKEEIDNWGLTSFSLIKAKQFSSLREIPKISFPDKNYNKMSYSFLAAHVASSSKENLSVYDAKDYNHFIFKDLQKGAQIGNLLHAIFEFIDYTDSAKWEEMIQNAVRSFTPSKIDDKGFLANLYSLVSFTMQANLGSDTDGNLFSLQSISRDKRVNELEFNFSLPNDFNMSSLEYLLQNDVRQIQTKRNGEVQGMMLGFIDLFFEHKGKYYILDWKSNFLGDTLAHYDEENVLKAMNESNYHLQYLIYAIAINKYLSSKIPNFDFETQFGGVIYLFLRGVRENQSSGVYFQKVTLTEVERMESVFSSDLNFSEY